jgi:hypothetical protein
MYRILRDALRVGIITEDPPAADPSLRIQAQRLERAALARFGHSLAIRHVDAGSCNGCELEIHALNNPYYPFEGLGFRFVASPRHAVSCWSPALCPGIWRPPSSGPMRRCRSPSWWSRLAIVGAMAGSSAAATRALVG